MQRAFLDQRLSDIYKYIFFGILVQSFKEFFLYIPIEQKGFKQAIIKLGLYLEKSQRTL